MQKRTLKEILFVTYYEFSKVIKFWDIPINFTLFNSCFFNTSVEPAI